MRIEDAYNLLGVYHRNISEDDLREIYRIKLSKCRSDRERKQINLAYQMIRNFRSADHWGTFGSDSDVITYKKDTADNYGGAYKYKKSQKAGANSFWYSLVSFLRFFLMLCGILFIILFIFALISV